jgi:hypothetical protein
MMLLGLVLGMAPAGWAQSGDRPAIDYSRILVKVRPGQESQLAAALLADGITAPMRQLYPQAALAPPDRFT